MMRTHEGAHHSVVAFDLRDDAARFVRSGKQITDIPCGDLIFEISSITKLFTGILLCLLIEEGKVEPARLYARSPKTWKMCRRSRAPSA
jgi:hypothetical protein